MALPAKSSPKRLLFMFAIGLFGLAVTVYLTFGYLQVTEIACTDAGCDLVRQWHDAHLPKAMIPILGVLFFMAISIVTLLIGVLDAKKAARLSVVNVGLATVGLAVAIGLTLLEGLQLHAYCFWCVLVAISVVLYFFMTIGEWRSWKRGSVRYDLDFEPFMKWGAAGLALVFLIATGLHPHSATPAAPPAGPAQPPSVLSRGVLIRPETHRLGPQNAPVTLVEFADPGCPACARENGVIEALLAKYPKQVKLYYRHFPLRSHVNSRLAAEAEEAAGAQGKFWRMRDLLFKNQVDQTEPQLLKLAQQAGLNMTRFKADLASHKFAARVERDREDGDQLQIHSTPTIFVNAEDRYGPVPLATLETAVQAHLPGPRAAKHPA